MASTGNGRLPPELWVQIFSMLASQDIKATRLACKDFFDLSSTFLIKRAYFALRPRTMDVLFQIARHPIFSKTVTELVYDITEVKKLLPGDGMYQTEDGNGSLDGFADACNLYTAQEASKESGDDLAGLKFAFSHMPKLRSVLCFDWRRIVQLLLDGNEPNSFAHLHIRDNQVFDCAEKEKMQAGWARCWYTSKGPMIWDRMDPHLFALNGGKDIQKSQNRNQLNIVLRAAYETKATISNFSFQYLPSSAQRHRVLPPKETLSRNASPWLFENLRHFSVSLGVLDYSSWILPTGILGRLLSRATRLETIALFSRMKYGYKIHKELGTDRWPCIRSTQLVGMYVDAEVLQAFFQRNAASLKEVDIGLVHVQNLDRRGEIADIMAQQLNLDGVRLGFQFIPQDRSIMDFDIMERDAMVRTVEARVLHGRSNSLRLA